MLLVSLSVTASHCWPAAIGQKHVYLVIMKMTFIQVDLANLLTHCKSYHACAYFVSAQPHITLFILILMVFV